MKPQTRFAFIDNELQKIKYGNSYKAGLYKDGFILAIDKYYTLIINSPNDISVVDTLAESETKTISLNPYTVIENQYDAYENALGKHPFEGNNIQSKEQFMQGYNDGVKKIQYILESSKKYMMELVAKQLKGGESYGKKR